MNQKLKSNIWNKKVWLSILKFVLVLVGAVLTLLSFTISNYSFIMPIITLIILFLIYKFGIKCSWTESLFYITWIIALAIILFAVVMYYFWKNMLTALSQAKDL